MTDADPIPVYFATNRDLISASPVRFGPRYNADRPYFYRVGRARVTRRAAPADPWDGAYEVDPAGPELFAETPPDAPGGAGLPGSAEAFLELRDRLRPEDGRRDVLLYLHGFASDLDTALCRAAELRDAWLAPAGDAGGAARSPLVFAFSWPSDGRAFGGGAVPPGGGIPRWAYFGDRDDAEASAKAIARSLARLLDHLARLSREERCHQRLHLVAHSMGNHALRHALQQLRAILDGARLPRILDTAFLMAADEDADALERDDKLGILAELARTIHVYHARDDLALTVSDATKFNPDRLGEAGPRDWARARGRVFGIDCSEVSDTILRHGRHQYYRLVPEVIRDVRAVLAGEPADRIAGRETVEAGRRFRILRDEALRRETGWPPRTAAP